jgi:hypothetical protein
MHLAILAAVLSIFTFHPQVTQQTGSASPQAIQLLQQSLAALNGTTVVRDITLSGSAHYIVGSDDETGTATLKAITGASRVDLSFSSGSRSEVRNQLSDPPTGSWSGPDGVSHTFADHNLFNEPSWFSPVAALSRLSISSQSVFSYVGAETLESQTVQHISSNQLPLASAIVPPLVSHLTQVDLYLDSSTLLPAAITFDTHPDDDELVDIPIEVRFSDYRPVNGAQIPFHVQKFINNSLVLDLQFDNATLNSGLSLAALTIQ